MNDLERLLNASIQIAQLKRQAQLAADAIKYLRETLADRDQTIALLEARLNIIDTRFAKERSRMEQPAQ